MSYPTYIIKKLNRTEANYSLTTEGLIDVDGDVDISALNLKRIPVKFGKVNGHFNCSHNRLISLEGSPNIVDGSFYCTFNNLSNLIGSPRYVRGSFFCSYNKLITLEGCPNEIGFNLYAHYNELVHIGHLLKTKINGSIFTEPKLVSDLNKIRNIIVEI